MKINLKIKPNAFNKVYYPYLLNYDNGIEVYYGGSGSGKSFFIAQKILIKSLQSKRKMLIIRKTNVSQKDSCWRLIIETLSEWGLLQYCQINKSDFTIELPNETILLFKGLDDSEKIKSIVGITDIWCEEATELTEDDFDQLRLRMRANVKDSQIFVSFNPISKANWVYRRWFENSTDDFVLRTTYKNNRFLPKQYVETLESMIETNPTYYKIYALGEFCSLDKLVYNNWKVSDEEPQGETIIGLDFGFSNDTAAIVISYLDEQNKKIYIVKEWGDTGKTNPELACIIKELGISKSVIIADSAEPKSIEELKRLGIMRIRESKKGPDSIIHGIQKLQQYQIIVNPKCTQVITELENYSWVKDKKTNEYINKPIDMFNHFLDALRYSLQCCESKIKVFSKDLLGL